MNPTRQNPVTILLVDDDPDFLCQMELQLRNAGYAVTTAADCREAEAQLAQAPPDLAVLDLMMDHPDDGFALCYHIKKKNPATPVILVTAVTSETGLEFDAATEEEKSWIRADAMLNKPVRFEQLTREIERLLRK